MPPLLYALQSELTCVRDIADAQQAMAAAAEAVAAPKPVSTLSSDLQAKIAANRAKALERRRAKASAAASAAFDGSSRTGDHDDIPSPEEEAEMMAAAAAASKPEEKAQVLLSASSSPLSPDDELDALMAEEEALGDLCVAA